MERIKKFNFKEQRRRILGLIISAFLLYAGVIIAADVGKILSLSAAFPWRVMPIIIVLVVINYGLRAARFHYLLKKINIRLPFAAAAAIFLSGLTMTITPGKVGEAVKAYLLKRRLGAGYTRTLPLLIFERVLDGMAMIILALGGVYLFPRRGVFLFFLLAFSLAAGFFVLVRYRRPAMFLTRWAQKRFDSRLHDRMTAVFDQAAVLTNWTTVGMSLVLSLMAWGLQGGALYILAKPLIPAAASLSLGRGLFYGLFIFSFSAIAAFLALVPAGILVAEGSLVSFLLLFFHLNLTQAIFVSLLFRLTTLWFGVALGSVFLAVNLKVFRGLQSPKT